MSTLSEAVAAEHSPLDQPPNWRTDAACRCCSPDLFFPAGTTGPAEHEVKAAKAVCGTCPVQSACLLYALQTRQDFGIWGGTTQEERRALRRVTQ
jgi:WhiB family redox-sensing transcriptional regulator